MFNEGWAAAKRGHTPQGIEQMQRGLAAYEATGAKLWLPYLLGLLAEALSDADRSQEGLAAITNALALAEQRSEGYAIAELYRIIGELTIKSEVRNSASRLQPKRANDGATSQRVLQAQDCFAKGLAIARGQHARSWELRIIISSCRLEEQPNEPSYSQLAESYSWFTEGHATEDLRKAKILLNTIKPPAEWML